MTGGDGSNARTGSNIIVAGLCLQIVFFGLFVFTGIAFHARLNKRPTRLSFETPWKRHMFSLYLVSILIFVRSIVRVAEFVQGFEGYIISHEWYIYVFDALLMWIACVILNWAHPGEVAKHLRAEGLGGQSRDALYQLRSVCP
jgi:SNF family Na+-dependent transporter